MLLTKFNKLCDEIRAVDVDSLNAYNERRKRDHPYFFDMGLGPCPFEGDILHAPVVLMLANPCSNNLKHGDHNPKSEIVKEFPLWGLHPSARCSLRDWWKRRLGKLIDYFNPQLVSQSIAAIQLNSWASSKFDASYRQPSRDLMLREVKSIRERGALLVIMRSERLWLESNEIADYHNKIVNKNPICSYVSEGNLGKDNWSLIVKSINEYRWQS